MYFDNFYKAPKDTYQNQTVIFYFTPKVKNGWQVYYLALSHSLLRDSFGVKTSCQIH